MSTIVPVDFVDVTRLAATLVLKHSVHFNDDTRRQNFPGSPHHDTRCIVLRGPEGGATPENWQADVPHEDQSLLMEWPSACQVIEAIGKIHKVRFGAAPMFGKVMIVGLKPGGVVDWHVDEGGYAEAHDRYHLCLCPSPYCLLFSGMFSANLPVGQLTWVNNRVAHSAVNFGPVERVHLIADIRKPSSVQ